MSKRDNRCGLSQESHQWIGDTCTDCGIAWNVWADRTIKALQQQLASLTAVREPLADSEGLLPEPARNQVLASVPWRRPEAPFTSSCAIRVHDRSSGDMDVVKVRYAIELETRLRRAVARIEELKKQVAPASPVSGDPSFRNRTAEEAKIIEELYRLKMQHRPAHAYATITRGLTLRKWDGGHDPSVGASIKTVQVPIGTTLKIVMVSRFGDCGLTDDLNAERGYNVRIGFDSPVLSNIRWRP